MTRDRSLDTSGVVGRPGFAKPLRWSDLSPFEQGYVEGIFASPLARSQTHDRIYTFADAKGFSDLGHETLALILRDCTAYQHRYPSGHLKTDHRARGANYWVGRQKGLKPLTPHLRDDGKIYLKGQADE